MKFIIGRSALMILVLAMSPVKKILIFMAGMFGT